VAIDRLEDLAGALAATLSLPVRARPGRYRALYLFARKAARGRQFQFAAFDCGRSAVAVVGEGLQRM